jgi:hypothetical protein
VLFRNLLSEWRSEQRRKNAAAAERDYAQALK